MDEVQSDSSWGKILYICKPVKLDNYLSKTQWWDRHRISIPISKGRCWKGRGVMGHKQIQSLAVAGLYPQDHCVFSWRVTHDQSWISLITSFPDCRIPDSPFFISSYLCPFQSKLAACLLRWLIGSTNHKPNLLGKLLSNNTLSVPSRGSFLIFCSIHRLRIF